MKLLLDTHAFVWAMTERSRLSDAAEKAIRDEAHELLVSAVSAYEIDYKRDFSVDLAKLPFDLDGARHLLRFEWINLTQGHATAAARLPRLHRDPWDRMLVAQAMAEDAVMVTADGEIGQYGLPVIW